MTGLTFKNLGNVSDLFEPIESSAESFKSYAGASITSSVLLGNDVQLCSGYCHASLGTSLGRDIGLKIYYTVSGRTYSGDIGRLLAKKGTVGRARWTSTSSAYFYYARPGAGSKTWSINLNSYVTGGSVIAYSIHSQTGQGSASISGSTLTCSLGVSYDAIAIRKVYVKFTYGAASRVSAIKLFSFELESEGNNN